MERNGFSFPLIKTKRAPYLSVIGFDQLSLFDMTMLKQSLYLGYLMIDWLEPGYLTNSGAEGGDEREKVSPHSKYG